MSEGTGDPELAEGLQYAESALQTKLLQGWAGSGRDDRWYKIGGMSGLMGENSKSIDTGAP